MTDTNISDVNVVEKVVAPVVVDSEKNNFTDYIKSRNTKVEPGTVKAKVADKPVAQTNESSLAEDLDTTPGEVFGDNSENTKPTKSKAERNIDKVVAQREALRSKLEAAELKLAEAELKAARDTKTETKESKQETPTDFNTPEPDYTQFKTIGEYAKALVKWERERDKFEAKQEAQRQQQESNNKNNTETWNKREKLVKESIDDYDVVVTMEVLKEFNITAPSHQAARNFLSDSEYGPEVLYALLNDEAKAKEFANALPLKQIKILDRIEAKVEESKTNTTTTKKPSTLDGLPPKLHAGGTKAPAKSISQATNFSDYVRLRNSR
jgi:hypothetical protein